MDKHNIVVCSKNRTSADTPSNVTVNLEQNLICNENEFWTVNVASFNMIKSFYAVQNNLNNGINVWLQNKSTGLFDDPYLRLISEGNYNVKTLIAELQEKLFDLIKITYDNRLNKFLFERLPTVVSDDYENVEDYEVFIEPINSGVFLGLENNVKFHIPQGESVFSNTFVNTSGYSNMMIKISGVSIENSIMNISNQYYQPSQVLAIIDLQQVAPMDSILFSADSLNSNNNVYKINDKKVSSFSIEIVNENNISFPQMSDFILNLCFERRSNQNEVSGVIQSILRRLNDLIFYILYVFEQMNLSQPEFS